MIVEYQRPKTLNEALELLARKDLVSIPLAGGSAVERNTPQAICVVDLQSLGLDEYKQHGGSLVLGATLSLQKLLDVPGIPAAILKAVHAEASYQLRQVASMAGTIVSADGRSLFTTSMLALDAVLTWQPGDRQISLGDWLPVKTRREREGLITEISLPTNAHLALEWVSRTPADLPLVCAAVARWPSGRTRLVMGGYGPAPILAFDGPEASGLETAAESAYAQAGDQWASAEYRSQIAPILVRRCLDQFDQV
jgi:CO/xanthine dehydrogenase FAD-binding subunit